MKSKNERAATEFRDHPIFIGRETSVKDARPQPPYMIFAENFFYLGVRFETDAARDVLPKQFRPLDDSSGVIGIYEAPEGWGLAPLSGTFFGVSVAETTAPDGSPTVFMTEQVFGGAAYEILHDDYNRRVRHGTTRTRFDGSKAFGEMRSDDGLEIVIEGKPRHDQTYPPTSGLHYYLGESQSGDINIYSVAFTARFTPIELTKFELGPAASERLKLLNPVEISWAMYIEQAPLTFSAPSPFRQNNQQDALAKAQQVGLMDILARIGHAAALVGRDGRTLFMTPDAQSMLETARVGGKFSVWRQSDQRALDTAIAVLGEGQSLVSDAIGIERPGSLLPILARALPVSSAMAGEPAILFLFSDPADPSAPTAETLLQVLGLTPAEARLAAQVGAGRSVRESADLVGITENTARSSLKIVYDKLGIGKQSELARIVARLG